MQKYFFRWFKGLLGLLCALQMSACGNDGWQALGEPNTNGIPNINGYPPMANNRPPGASQLALDTALALGRGVNFGNMLEAPNEGDWGLELSDEFIQKAADAQFRTVRLPVRWSNHASTTQPYKINEAFMTRVEGVVDALLNAGFYVILDMHHHRQLDGDVLDSGEASVDEAALNVRFLIMWEQIAERFASRNNRLIFELYNEPHGRLSADLWNDLAARALRVVRKTNAERLVMIGATQWNAAAALSSLKIPNDANIIATIHHYEPFDFTHQGAEWVSPQLPTGVTCCSTEQLAQIEAPLDIAKEWSSNSKYPVFVGEFGAYSKADESSRIAYNRALRDAAEARGMSWAYWEFASGFGVYDPDNKVFRQALLDSLLK